jgi:glycosyltransferase involved in cell wall biosynthesis
MPEIAGDAAAIVDPFKPEEILTAIERILEDENFRNELCEKGIERAKLFSWENMAAKYLELYEEVYAEIKDI